MHVVHGNIIMKQTHRYISYINLEHDVLVILINSNSHLYSHNVNPWGWPLSITSDYIFTDHLTCSPSWFKRASEDTCYKIHHGKATFEDAEAYCETHGAFLAAVWDVDELNFIADTIAGVKYFDDHGLSSASRLGTYDPHKSHSWRNTDGSMFK